MRELLSNEQTDNIVADFKKISDEIIDTALKYKILKLPELYENNVVDFTIYKDMKDLISKGE